LAIGPYLHPVVPEKLYRSRHRETPAQYPSETESQLRRKLGRCCPGNAYVKVGGTDYDISHLAPFIYTLTAAGPDGIDIRVRVSFSCHAFSEKAARNATFDFPDQNGNHRIFCANRYAKCLALPQGVRNLFDQNGITWEMKDHNQIENMAALAHNPAVRIVRGTHDVILYYFYPSNSEHFEIEMNVLTCHERAVNTNDKHKLDMKQAVRTCYFSN
ncbi:hypothetical protein, partial [Sulfitobacter litoralis]|uniref:hypothetical protein n=1 Tax=Sulfitobacter litoralis TaxID=335975 RepID=UPI00235335BB